MKESGVEAYLHERVTALGGDTRKFVSPGRNGVPDRIVMWPSGEKGPFYTRIHFVETKRPDGELRVRQQREHKALKKFGCIVLTIYNVADVDNYVRNYAIR